MGLFQHKQTPDEEATEEIKQIFDDAFREELKQHGREYFEKTISENAAVFKQDLDTVVAQVNTELREQILTRLDKQLEEYGQAMKDAQYLALQSLNRSQHTLQDRYDDLSKQLDAQFVEYSTAMKNAQGLALQSLTQSAEGMQGKHDELSAKMDLQFVQYGDALKSAQEAALQSLTKNSDAMQQQYQQFDASLREKVATQEATIITAFEGNMARIIEQYLLGALGDEYDLKSQLPSIIKQMEANKQNIVDDMKL